MNAGERARRQRCRMLEIAAVFGLLLTVFAIVGRTRPAVAVGLVGVAVAPPCTAAAAATSRTRRDRSERNPARSVTLARGFAA